MNADTLLREWSIITGLLPSDWRELARTTGALTREREIRDPDTLLLLILMHVAAGLSMRQTAARAERVGLARISDVALRSRMCKSERWLRILAERLFAAGPLGGAREPASTGRRIRVVDATTVSEPGSTGTDWRVHYSLELPTLQCDFFEVTGASGGETYARLPVRPGDIILGDRGYSHREGVAHVVDAGGDVVVRLNTGSFPLCDGQGGAFDLLNSLRTLPEHEAGEWPVSFTAHGRSYSARLVGIRKSAAAAKESRDKILRAARKKQKSVRPETLEAAGYVIVLTTLGAETPASEVLELYRARWQVELAFKRMKSLFGAGHVPKKDPQAARAWIHGKLLAVLLIERLGELARLFSPWGYALSAGESLAGVHRSSRQPARGSLAGLPSQRIARAWRVARQEAERTKTNT
jgi:hypothetical protein